MPSLRFFLVALLATIALAHPSPARGKLVARSFKVPRSLNPDHPTGLNGGYAMAKAYRKFGWGLIGARHRGGKSRKPKASTNTTTPTTTTPNTTKAETGEVTATPKQNAALFLSPVTIGGQTLNMDFDTGSSDLWVFSTSLSQATIGGHSTFDPTQSKTFKNLQGATFSISYGDGSGAAGTVGADTVDIGGATVTSQAVELATAVSQSFVADASTDGLVGLAFSTLNTVKPTKQKTFFDNIMGTLDEPVFTANLKNDTSGTYEFGKIDNTLFQGDLSWIPINASSGFWEFNSTSFTINGKTQQNPTGSPAIADTGTSLLLVDDAVAQAYYAQVQGAVNDAQAGGFTYPCTATLPDFGVAIGDSYVANVPGNQITFSTVDTAGTTCFGGVQSNGGATLQIYGDTMFKAQFVAFNGGNQSLGFAPKA